MKVVSAVKIEYAIELLETQDLYSLIDYLNKISKSKKRTDTMIVKDPRFSEIMSSLEILKERKVKHPKMIKLKEVVLELVKNNPRIRIIVFANYRNTVDKINKMLRENSLNSEIFIGQANKEGKGLKQEQQIELLRRFGSDEFNVLVSTSIGEEGLDVPAVDYVIFYEPVPSEIRTIQRRGRVGRQVAGKIIFLITKDTRDEAYYWTAFHKERKMKGILYDMKDRLKSKKERKTLKDFI